MSSLMHEMSQARQFRMNQARDYGASHEDLTDLYQRLKQEYDYTKTGFDIADEQFSQLPAVKWADIDGIVIDKTPLEDEQRRIIRELKEADQASIEMGVAVALMDAALERIKQERQGE